MWMLILCAGVFSLVAIYARATDCPSVCSPKITHGCRQHERQLAVISFECAIYVSGQRKFVHDSTGTLDGMR